MVETMFNVSVSSNFTNGSHEKGSTQDHGALWAILEIPIFAAIIITALTGNIFVCIVIHKFRQLQTTTNYALVSLAITDVLMVYVMLLHATMVVKNEWTFGVTLCDVTSTIGLTLNLVSLVHLTYISFDRYIAIMKPFRYQIWITKLRVVVAMVILWISCCFILNLPWADFKYRSNVFGCLTKVKRGTFRVSTLVMLLLFVTIPTAFILFTHISICRIAREHATRLRKQQNNLSRSYAQDSDNNIADSVAAHDISIVSLASFKRELKSVKTFGIVVGCFLICYVPFYTVATLRSFRGLDSVPEHVLTTVTWFGFTNSCVNPILYSLRHRQFKNAFRKIFRGGLRKVVPLEPTSVGLAWMS